MRGWATASGPPCAGRQWLSCCWVLEKHPSAAHSAPGCSRLWAGQKQMVPGDSVGMRAPRRHGWDETQHGQPMCCTMRPGCSEFMPGSCITGTLQPAVLAPQALHHCHHRPCITATSDPTSLAPCDLRCWHCGPCIASIADPTSLPLQTPHGGHCIPCIAGTADPAPLALRTLHCWCWGACIAGAEDAAWLALRALAQQTCMAGSSSAEGTPLPPACPGCVGLCYPRCRQEPAGHGCSTGHSH